MLDLHAPVTAFRMAVLVLLGLLLLLSASAEYGRMKLDYELRTIRMQVNTIQSQYADLQKYVVTMQEIQSRVADLEKTVKAVDTHARRQSK